MLQSLYVKDFAIAETIELECEGGLTVVTGETGAGKSIVVDALSLALGGRTDASAIRHGAPYAEITATFAPPAHVQEWLAEQELDADGECIARRVIHARKPAKSYLNGRPTTAQTLRALGALLVDIHGQHEHQRLLKREVQRRLVDRYGDLEPAVAGLAETYRELEALKRRITELEARTTGDQSELELLRYHISELEELRPGAEEYAELETEQKRLAHAEELRTGVDALLHVLYDADEHAVKTTLDRGVDRLLGLIDYDPGLTAARDALERAGVEIDDAITDLRTAATRADLDPDRLREVEERIGVLLDMARKHRCAPQQLPDTLARLRTQRDELENLDAIIGEARAAYESAYRDYLSAAAALSERRADAAQALSAAVTARLQDLGFNGGELHIRVTPLPEDRVTAHGLDHIEFEVRTNPDQPHRPLARIVSGGELSRISLAIQVTSRTDTAVPTVIFDEVDVGIGGRVAEIVGQQLRELGGTHQVLCVTHLPQVAAQGHHHTRVYKTTGARTRVDVETLDERQRVEELARMLGGVEITRQTLAHAEDLLGRLAS